MKRVIRVIDNTEKGQPKVIEHEIKVRDLEHLKAQIKYKSMVVMPKKGKGSYSRKQKHKEDLLNGR